MKCKWRMLMKKTHLLSQFELNDLVRDLSLSKEKAELLSLRLLQWNLLQEELKFHHSVFAIQSYFHFTSLKIEYACKIRKSRTGRCETKTRENFLFKNAQSQKLSILLADCRAVIFCKRNHSISKELCKNKQ